MIWNGSELRHTRLIADGQRRQRAQVGERYGQRQCDNASALAGSTIRTARARKALMLSTFEGRQRAVMIMAMRGHRMYGVALAIRHRGVRHYGWCNSSVENEHECQHPAQWEGKEC